MLQETSKYLNYFLLVSLLGGLYACRNQGGNLEEEIIAKTPVTIAPISFRTITETVDFPAVSAYIRKNVIRSSATGTVDSITVAPGDHIKRGKILFAVKTIEASALQKSNAGDSIPGFKGIIKIISPEDGIISSVSHQKGDFVQQGDELALISEQNSLVFILEVPFELRKYIEQNGTCTLKLPDNTLIKGVISGRLPEMNVQSQTVSYLVKPLFTGSLPQNLIVSASVIKSLKTDALVLPKAAVLGNETQTEFWVMKIINDSTAVKVPVGKGIENNEEVEITAPSFLPGDRILLTGNYGLPDTAAIIIKQ